MDEADGRSALLEEFGRALGPVGDGTDPSRLAATLTSTLAALPADGRSALLGALARVDASATTSTTADTVGRGGSTDGGEVELPPDGRSALVEALLRTVEADPAGERSEILRGALSSLLGTPQGRSALVGLLARSGRVGADLSPGSRVGRFVLDRELGRGGFGVVFEARDTTLGRQVALKLVRPGGQLPSDLRQRTARREAEAIARLTHPNIVTVHDFGNCDAGPYIVMELLHGESLARRLRREPFPLREALRISIEVARALDHAHGAGILHRDLKPANLLLTRDGVVKVLDFGFAEIFGEGQRLEGGTPAYMSPEQHEARSDQDARTDVWSAAVMLFHMVTGELPFHPARGWTPDAGREPVALPALPGAPPSLGPLLRRALSVDRAGRPADGRAWREALEEALRELDAMERPAGGGSGLVVLPFADLGGTDDGKALAGTLTEMLISELARVPALRVVPLSTSMRFRDSGRTVAQIGAELGVGMAIEGSVARSGDFIQVRVRLLDSATERQVWTERYRQPVGNVLEVLDAVIAKVADALGAMLGPSRAGASGRRPVAGASMDCYLRGRYHQGKRTPEGFAAAIAEYRAANDADPLFVPPYVATAFIHLASAIYGHAQPQQSLALARSYAERALALDPGSGPAMGSLALVQLFLDHDFDGALELGLRSVQASPREVMTRIMLGDILWTFDRDDDAMTQIMAAHEIDPLELGVNMNVGDFLTIAGRLEEAVAAYRHTLRINPNFVPGQVRLAKALAFLGDRSATESALESVTSNAPEPLGLETAALCLASIGARDRALPLVREVERRAGMGRLGALAAANAWGALGEGESALQWVERAWELAEPNAVFVARYPATSRHFETAPFQEFGRRVGLPRFRAAPTPRG